MTKKYKKKNNIEEQYSPKYGKTMYAYNVMIDGRRRGRQFIYHTAAEAQTALGLLRLQLRDEADGLAPLEAPPQTLTDLRKEAESNNVSRRDLQALDVFIDTQEEKGATPLYTLLRADWKGFYKAYGHLKPSSQNRYRTRVAGLLSRAVTWFKELEAWEWTPPKPERLDDGECGRDYKIGKVEMARLLASCLAPQQPGEMRKTAEARREMYDFMRLRLLTATRPGEILKLTPARVDWEEKMTIIVTKKGRKIKKRPIYFTRQAMAILEPRMRKERFFSFTKSQIKTVCEHIVDVHNKLFPDYPATKYGARVEGGWVLGDLRRTCATLLESHTDAPYSAVMAVLGHARADMTAKYTSAEKVKIKDAFEKLEAYVLEIDAIQKNLRTDSDTQAHGKILVNNPVKEPESEWPRASL